MTQGRSTSEMQAIPEELSWERAEQVLRAHFARQGRPILDVSPEPLESLGTAFWVRHAEGQGGLVLVRGERVFATNDGGGATGSEVLAALLAHDRFHQTRQISASDFLYLMQQLDCMPELPADPFDNHRFAALNPRWEHGPGGARFILHAPVPRTAPRPRGAEVEGFVEAVRATLRIDDFYAMSSQLESLHIELDEGTAS